MCYLSMDHTLLTPRETPVGEAVDRFPVPWAPEWQVLRARTFHGRPIPADARAQWLERPAWPVELRDRYVAQVLDGRKTATCSSVISYAREADPVPRAGDLSVVTDSTGVPRVLLRTTEAVIRAFGEVDATFAYDEGEGDRSYAYWREGHERFFADDAAEARVASIDELEVVCERFEVAARFGL